MKTIKLLLRNSLLAKKYLVIKNLILEKLNILIDLTQQSDQHALHEFQKIQEITDIIMANSRLTLENQVFLLKSSVDTVQAVQKSISTSESALGDLRGSLGGISQAVGDSYSDLERSIAGISQSVGDSYSSVERSYRELGFVRQDISELKQDHNLVNAANKQLLLQIGDDLRSQKYKVVTDASHFQAIEIELMVYLYSFLPYRLAIDVGANRGDVSVRLLQTGYEVYAFEPFPPVLEKLKQRLANQPHFHALPYALGAVNETRELHLAADLTEKNTYEDSTFYNSLLPHSLAEGLVFKESLSVIVKTLSDLHQSGEVPSQVGLVKIDTEGFDLEVIRGMGDYRYPVVMAEFWDPGFPFGKSGTMNYLKDMVPAMRERNYPWHIVVYRIWGVHEISYYCNSSYSLENSWGNVFFFQDQLLFQEALKWCNATMPATYFAV
jgi:FkbM family methyltransferase